MEELKVGKYKVRKTMVEKYFHHTWDPTVDYVLKHIDEDCGSWWDRFQLFLNDEYYCDYNTLKEAIQDGIRIKEYDKKNKQLLET